ncbi:MAG: capsid cement protein [Rhodoglobus sp.]
MADYLPKFKPGQAVTFKASAGVTGGRLVVVTGSRTVGPAGADANAIGVAGFDAVTGEDVTVFTSSGGLHPLIASAAIAAGAKVISAATGKVATIGAGTNPIGTAITAAAADNDVIDVLFN